MEKQFSTSKYEKRNFKGTDISLNISLNEYGLIWKKYKRANKKKGIKKGEYLFIYTYYNFDEKKCLSHSFLFLENKEDILNEYSWVNWQDIINFCGFPDIDIYFNNTDIPIIISDLISYYGTVNLFGENYF
jgi:hypothetical protein